MKKALQKVWCEIKASPVSVTVVVVCVIILIFLPILTGKATTTTTTTTTRQLSEIVKKCKAGDIFNAIDKDNVLVGDIQASRLDSQEIKCIYYELELPEYIKRLIAQTAILDTTDSITYIEPFGSKTVRWVTYTDKSDENRVFIYMK